MVVNSAAQTPTAAPDTVSGFVSGRDNINLSLLAITSAGVSYHADGSAALGFTDASGQGTLNITGTFNPSDLTLPAEASLSVMGSSSAETILATSGAETLYGSIGGGDVFNLTRAVTGAHSVVVTSTTQTPLSHPDTVTGFVSGRDNIDLSGVATSGIALAYSGAGLAILYFFDGNGEAQLNVYGSLNPNDIIVPPGALLYVEGEGSGQTIVGGNGLEQLNTGAGGGGTFDLTKATSGEHSVVVTSSTQTPISSPDNVIGFVSGRDNINLSGVATSGVALAYGANVVLSLGSAGSASLYFFDGNGEAQLNVTGSLNPNDITLPSGALLYVEGFERRGDDCGRQWPGATEHRCRAVAIHLIFTKATSGQHSVVVTSTAQTPLGHADTVTGFVSGRDNINLGGVATSGVALSYGSANSATLYFFDGSGEAQLNVSGSLNPGDITLPSGAYLYVTGSSAAQTLTAANGLEYF